MTDQSSASSATCCKKLKSNLLCAGPLLVIGFYAARHGLEKSALNEIFAGCLLFAVGSSVFIPGLLKTFVGEDPAVH